MHLIYARDERLLHLLDEHLVLTTEQINEALFGALRSCQRRLAHLKDLELLDSFGTPRDRERGGSGQPRWVLGRLGLDFHAAARDERMTTPAKAAAYTARLSQRPSLSHLLGVNGFFTALLGQARRDPDLRLVQWWSERTVASWFPFVHPDGLGLWRDYGDEIAFFIEHDTGSENHGRLIDKLTGYEHLTQVGPTYPVLFCLPSHEREANPHTNLAGHHGRVTVATAVNPLPDPSDAVWAIVGHRPPTAPAWPTSPATTAPPTRATPSTEADSSTRQTAGSPSDTLARRRRLDVRAGSGSIGTGRIDGPGDER